MIAPSVIGARMPEVRYQASYVSPLQAGTVHADVITECQESMAKGRPFTNIRPLLEGVDDPKGHSCDGSAGNHNKDCKEKVVAVQYVSSQGESVFYCEPHALSQNDWDIIHYDSQPIAQHEMTEEAKIAVQKILAKIGRKKRKREEIQEIDPAD
jgi:hypothetical protein